MKEPHQIFADVYLEHRQRKGHQVAVAVAFAALLFDLQSRGIRNPDLPAIRLKDSTDRWNIEAAADIVALRELLRHEWTDWVLGTIKR